MHDYTEIDKHLESLRGQNSIAEETLSFFSELIRLQADCCKKLLSGPAAVNPSSPEADQLLRQGSPLLQHPETVTEAPGLAEVFRQMLDVFRRSSPTAPEKLAGIDAALKEDRLDPGRLVERLIARDAEYFSGQAARCSVSAALLLYCTVNLAKPFMAAAAAPLQDLVQNELWNRHTCPVCGGSAGLARLSKEEEGRRYLYCGLCETAWSFSRVTCCFCGTDDTAHLKFIEIESTPYRLDVCDRCRRYIKTRDDRRLATGSGFIPALEELSTMHIDLVAEKEGYERSVFPPEQAGAGDGPADDTIH